MDYDARQAQENRFWELYKSAVCGVSTIPDITPENAAGDAMAIAKAAEREWENEMVRRRDL